MKNCFRLSWLSLQLEDMDKIKLALLCFDLIFLCPSADEGLILLKGIYFLQ